MANRSNALEQEQGNVKLEGMMSTTAFRLGLPTDIPWERICVSKDMMDRTICDAVSPPKFHSSIAVFKYTPPDDFQQYPNYQISYLKVAVTVTGFQPRDAEVEGQIDWNGLSTELLDNIEALLNEYHPCTGAIVQVSVAPKDSSITDVEKYPFFIDFEPKKRELFEMATDTSERLSRSLDTLNVAKSAQTTQSLEVLDIDMGGSFGAQASYLGTGGGFTSSSQGQWGTKQIGSNQSGVLRTTDNSQEKREGQSFTTQISQLYHQLNSYHVGTNRAMFFVEPRPHVLEVPSGFVRGPRQVEGIQEFFLVVAKPKAQADFCVSVRLDTAHLAEVDIMDYAYRKDSIDLSVSASPPERNDPQAVRDGNANMTVEAPITGTDIGTRRYACFRKRVEDVNNYVSPWSDYKIDVADGGGYRITANNASYGAYSVDVTSDGESLSAKVWADSRKCFDDGGTVCFNCPDTRGARSANSSLSLVINLISREPIRKIGTDQVLLITTRGLCCCERSLAPPIGVVAALPLRPVLDRVGPRFGIDSGILERLTVRPRPLDIAETTPAVTALVRPLGGLDVNLDTQLSPLRLAPTATPAPTPEAPRGLTPQQANAFSLLVRDTLTVTVAPSTEVIREPVPFIQHDFFIRRLETRLRSFEKVRQQGSKVVGQFLAVSPDRAKVEAFFGKSLDQTLSRDVVGISVPELARVMQVQPRVAASTLLQSLGVPLRQPTPEQPPGPGVPPGGDGGGGSLETAPVFATGSLKLADRVVVLASSGAAGAIVNSGTGATELGVEARTGNVWSGGTVTLRNRARVAGFVKTNATVVRQTDAAVTSGIIERAGLTFPAGPGGVTFPTGSFSDVNVEPDKTASINPGSFKNVSVKSRALLNLVAGTYFFESLAIEPQGELRLDKSGGAVVINVRTRLAIKGAVSVPAAAGCGAFIRYVGAEATVVEAPYRGTLLVPNAALTLATVGSAGFRGVFQARDVEVRPDVTIRHEPC
jgi:hypothetical protein